MILKLNKNKNQITKKVFRILEVGMALLIRVGKGKDLPTQPTNWPQCGDYKFLENGAVKFNNSHLLNILILLLLLLIFQTLIVSINL